jgi:hypothetical protein
MTRFLTAAAFALAIAWTPAVLAQAAPPAAETTQDFSDTDLKSFASALVEVSRINDNYLPIYHAAKSPEEQQAIEQKASTEMVQAVQNVGMSVDKYHQILAKARSNPEVANRINEHVKEAVTR